MSENPDVPAAEPIGRGRALVVMPTYNEAGNLAAIVPVVLDQDPRIDVLVVDDASPDGTGEVADRMASENSRVRVVHREGKQGLGSAYLRGFTWGLERGYEFLLEMDSDHSHDPKYLPALLEAAEGDLDLVIGSRYVSGLRHQLADESTPAVVVREQVRARGDRTPPFGRDGRVQVLPARGAGGDRLLEGRVDRLYVPDRDGLPGLEEGISSRGGPDRVRGPHGR